MRRIIDHVRSMDLEDWLTLPLIVLFFIADGF